MAEARTDLEIAGRVRAAVTELNAAIEAATIAGLHVQICENWAAQRAGLRKGVRVDASVFTPCATGANPEGA